jgi:transposase-like protein
VRSPTGWEDYQAFTGRDLAGIEVEYLFVDSVFEALRRHGAKEAVLVCWCIATDGRKHLLHLGVGNKESEACWTEFFRSLLGRGLRLPTTATSDGAPGLVKAIEVCFPTTLRIRCWFHRLANIHARLPDEIAGEVLAHVHAVRDAPTLDAARAAADRFTNTYSRTYPAAVACFTDDLDALLNIHRVPVRHRIRVRTTNLYERSFVEERRTKVIPRFTDEKAAMKLVFATLVRAADRGAASASPTSGDTSSNCCAPNSGSTHHPPATTTRPAVTRRQQHEPQAIRYRTLRT